MGPQTVRHLLGPSVVVGPRSHQPTGAVLGTADPVPTVSDNDAGLAASRDGLTVLPRDAVGDFHSSEADLEADNSVTFFNPSTGLPLTDNCGLDTSGHVVDQNWDYSFGPVDNGGNFNDDFG